MRQHNITTVGQPANIGQCIRCHTTFNLSEVTMADIMTDACMTRTDYFLSALGHRIKYEAGLKNLNGAFCNCEIILDNEEHHNIVIETVYGKQSDVEDNVYKCYQLVSRDDFYNTMISPIDIVSKMHLYI